MTEGTGRPSTHWWLKIHSGKREGVIRKDCQVSGFSGLGYWLSTSTVPQDGRLRRRERILWKVSSVSDMLSMGTSLENCPDGLTPCVWTS